MMLLSFVEHLGISGAQIFDWFVAVVNFCIMFFIFRLVVIIPMQEAVKLREQRVALRLKEIEQTAREAEETKVTFQAKFGEIDTVLAEIKETSGRSLAQVKQRLEERAASEERYVLEKAEAEAEAIKREAESTVRSRLAESAIVRAEALLAEALDATAQDKIISSAVKKMGELSAS